ncbi:MAG: hypothetical protein COT17_02035 [Elusimicrobia bacterium CG08_land_8_20_14_0_20_51_18]|nr:MAG: hypothetical protein COT17_02035 [Elusimicrobia bacterium CG08_land_8_20_14_0_20_51_18]
MIKMNVKTGRKEELVDITARISAALAETGVADGVCHIYCPHTTCALTINENADPDVRKDLTAGYRDIVSEELPYAHAEGNSTAHIKSSLTGVSLSVFVENSALCLGTWQGVYLCEFDGPRSREVWVKAVKG